VEDMKKTINDRIRRCTERDVNPGPLRYATAAQPTRRDVHFRAFWCLGA